MGYERFLAPEIFFQPDLVTLDPTVPALPEVGILIALTN